MIKARKTFLCIMAAILMLGCLQAGILIASAAEGTEILPGDIDIPLVSTTESTGASCKHTYGSWVSLNEKQHERTCSSCSAVNRAAHTWDGGSETKKPTCKEAGEWTYTCVACSATKKEPIEKLTEHTFDNLCDTECNVCGASRTAVHSYSDTWSSDKNRHWYACTVCNQKKDASTHTPGAAATESTPQTCTVCGYIITAATGHKHSYNDTWTSDSAGHWYACTGCGAKKNYKEHTYDNDCDTDCNACGAKRMDSHSYSSAWSSDKNGHWHECKVCAAKKDEDAHTPSTAATKTTPQTCTVCGYIITPVIGHKHSFAAAWTTNTVGHWHACPGCSEQEDYGDHVFDNACDTNCNTCGYARQTEHDFSSDWTMDEKEHWYLCRVCGAKADVQEHTFEATEDGAQACAACAYSFTLETQEPTAPNISHDYETDTDSHLWFNVIIIALIAVCVAALVIPWIIYKRKEQS